MREGRTERRVVLVLGANGFVGQRVCAALAASGWAEPWASARHGAPVTLDATDGRALADIVPGVDAIVSCVGGPVSAMAASAHALAKVLRLRGPDAPVLVFLGSMAAYGAVEGNVNEAAPLRGDLSLYAKVKAEAERALAAAPYVIHLRPGCIYGRGAPLWNVLVERLLRAHRLGDLGEAASACSNLVHVDDVADAAVRVLQLGLRSGVFNLAMANAPSWNAYFAAYAGVLGLDPLPVIGPGRLRFERKTLGPALKLAEVVLGRLHPAALPRLPARIPASLLDLWHQDIRLDAGRAERELGLQWRPLLPSLEAIVAARH